MQQHQPRQPEQPPQQNPPGLPGVMRVPFQKFRVRRSGAKDLAFDGYLLGRAERSVARQELSDSGLTVSVYVTMGGKYITHVEREDVLGEVTARAAVHDDPGSAYAWLVADSRGKLGPVSKAAWEQACRNWPALLDEDVERVP